MIEKRKTDLLPLSSVFACHKRENCPKFAVLAQRYAQRRKTKASQVKLACDIAITHSRRDGAPLSSLATNRTPMWSQPDAHARMSMSSLPSLPMAWQSVGGASWEHGQPPRRGAPSSSRVCAASPSLWSLPGRWRARRLRRIPFIGVPQAAIRDRSPQRAHQGAQQVKLK